MHNPKISIIVPTFNGKHLLERTLAHNIAALPNAGDPAIEWVISDDASTDDTVQWLATTFPDVRIVTSTANRGFGHTAHQGAVAATGDILFFLNNDMKIMSTDLDVIQNHLSHPDHFAVVPEIRRPSKNNAIESITWGYFKGGWMSAESYVPDAVDTTVPQPILWACGGAMWVLKSRYLALGGFDPLFLPFYFEDLDLSYRAWQRGWQCTYVPSSGLIHHDHQATISTMFPKAKVEAIHLRHYYLFMWKNLSSPGYLFSHCVTLILKLLTVQLRDIKAIVSAALSLREVLRYRWNRPRPVMTDSAILNLARFSAPAKNE